MRSLFSITGLLLTLASVSGFASKLVPIPLSQLDLTKMKQGFGTPQANLSVDKHPLSIGGRAFAAGVGTHSPGSLFIALDGSKGNFHAFAGIDDEVGKRGSATFTVIGDGKILWKSGVMRGGEAAKEVSTPLKGVHILALLVGDAGDGFNYDHADWADATIESRGKVSALDAPAEPDPEIAPTSAPDKPVLHCAEQYGALPETPR